jgi:hypothetical protein
LNSEILRFWILLRQNRVQTLPKFPQNMQLLLYFVVVCMHLLDILIVLFKVLFQTDILGWQYLYLQLVILWFLRQLFKLLICIVVKCRKLLFFSTFEWGICHQIEYLIVKFLFLVQKLLHLYSLLVYYTI